MNERRSYQYINDFLYFVIRPDAGRGQGTLIYCSGVNLRRFLPITAKRHGQASNPAFRGLQLVNLSVRALALSKGATPKTIRGNDCAGIAPTEDNWYTELLLIEDAPVSFPEEMIHYCVITLLQKINKACMLRAQVPDTLLSPDALQDFLDNLCKRYGRGRSGIRN